MSFVHTLDEMAAALKETICKGWQLKPRSLEDEADTESWEYELVEPAVFAWYPPARKNLPPDVKATVPAICIDLVEAADDLYNQMRALKIRLSFCAWDPGIHGPDILTPTGEGKGMHQAYEQGEPGTFERTADGWRDVWNFVDRALRIIESTESIGRVSLDRSAGVEFGAYDYQDKPPEYWAYWQAWAELVVNEVIIRSRPEIDQYL